MPPVCHRPLRCRPERPALLGLPPLRGRQDPLTTRFRRAAALTDAWAAPDDAALAIGQYAPRCAVREVWVLITAPPGAYQPSGDPEVVELRKRCSPCERSPERLHLRR